MIGGRLPIVENMFCFDRVELHVRCFRLQTMNLVHIHTDLCLDLPVGESSVVLKGCADHASQKWTFEQIPWKWLRNTIERHPLNPPSVRVHYYITAVIVVATHLRRRQTASGGGRDSTCGYLLWNKFLSNKTNQIP